MLLAVEDEGLATARDRREVHARRCFEDAARGRDPRRPTSTPKATEHIPEMIALTGDARRARTTPTSWTPGRVYFDVTSVRRTTAGSRATRSTTCARGIATSRPIRRKRHAADFALWKAAGPGRLMKWPSPWGEGFPGWHIECSAMSMKYLGDRFDIHTGGNDLRFPHHEDEIAQSEGAVGHQVVSIWVHGGHLRLSGQKIAKSTGNVVRVADLVERRPRSAGVPVAHASRRATAARWTSRGRRWRTPTSGVKQLRRPDGGLGAGRRRARRRGGGRSTRGSARRSPTDLDLPAAVVIVNELVSHRPTCPTARSTRCSPRGTHVLGLDLEREATTRLGAHRRRCGHSWPSATRPAPRRTSPPRDRAARPAGGDGPRGHGHPPRAPRVRPRRSD